MDKELEDFKTALLDSVKEMKEGKAARTHKVDVSLVAEARAKVGMSQAEFASLLDVSKRTLQGWEQGRREPTGAAKTLIKIAFAHPEVLRELQNA